MGDVMNESRKCSCSIFKAVAADIHRVWKVKGFEMDERNGYGKSVFVARIVVLLAAVVCVGLGGCSNKMARFEENQLRLQALVETNAHQIGKAAQRAEQNQQDLQTAMKLIHNSTEELAAQIVSFGSEHAKLQARMQAGDAQMSDKIAGIEQKQQASQSSIDDLQNGTVAVAADMAALGENQAKIGEMIDQNRRTLAGKVKTIEDYQGRLQSEIRNVQAGTAQVAADLAAVADAHSKLEETAQNERERTDGKLSALEQDRLEQQKETEAIMNNVRKLTASVDALEGNLLKLQEVLQNDIQNLADVIEVVGQGQIEFEGNVESRIGELANSMGLLEQNQTELRKQAEEMRSSNQAVIGNLAAMLDQLKTRISSIVPAEPPKVAKTKVTASEEVKQPN